MIKELKQYWRRFRYWQLHPYVPDPLNDEQHVCLNCGESYNGQFCPRCGQNSKTDTLTSRHVLSNALDVWGAGNRSMPRNIIHLLFRPGYMIADYLKGHRQPYFPPFKMLFILVTTFVVMTSAVTYFCKVEETNHSSEFDVEILGSVIEKTVTNPALLEKYHDKAQQERIKRQSHRIVTHFHKAQDWLDDHRAVGILLFQVFFAFGAWLFFRKSPRMGKLSLSEQFFAQVFISSQMIILSFFYYFLSLTWVRGGDDDLPGRISVLFYLIDYKQLYGFGWWKTIWRHMMMGFFTILIYLMWAFLLVTIIIFLLIPEMVVG